MNPWVYGAAGAVLLLLVLLTLYVVRAQRRERSRLRAELARAHSEVEELSERLERLATEVAEELRVTRHELATVPAPEPPSYVITGLVTEPDPTVTEREVQLVEAIEAGKPEWVPHKPVREALVRAMAYGYGVRRALSPEKRDRIRLEMQAEVRRSRRQRKAELRSARRYLRQQRNTAA